MQCYMQCIQNSKILIIHIRSRIKWMWLFLITNRRKCTSSHNMLCIFSIIANCCIMQAWCWHYTITLPDVNVTQTYCQQPSLGHSGYHLHVTRYLIIFFSAGRLTYEYKTQWQFLSMCIRLLDVVSRIIQEIVNPHTKEDIDTFSVIDRQRRRYRMTDTQMYMLA
jgi:hypothetical protein